jgi:predicted nucleic acid-binding protein
MQNIFWLRTRGQQLTKRAADEARNILRTLAIEKVPSDDLLDLAFSVAMTTDQTVYDSLYVALAHTLKVPVVTADRKLLRSVQNSKYLPDVLWVEDLLELFGK